MGRINYPLTLGELQAELSKAIKKYGKDKYILLADDEEGNGFHECYFAFTDTAEFDEKYYFFPSDLNKKDCIILG